MSVNRVAPTKSNLLKISGNLAAIREGYDLLEQKREILVVELLGLIDRTAHAQENLERQLEQAYLALEEAAVRVGRRRLSQLAAGADI